MKRGERGRGERGEGEGRGGEGERGRGKKGRGERGRGERGEGEGERLVRGIQSRDQFSDRGNLEEPIPARLLPRVRNLV